MTFTLKDIIGFIPEKPLEIPEGYTLTGEERVPEAGEPYITKLGRVSYGRPNLKIARKILKKVESGDE